MLSGFARGFVCQCPAWPTVAVLATGPVPMCQGVVLLADDQAPAPIPVSTMWVHRCLGRW